MGKFDIMTKVFGKATAMWRNFIKRSPLFIVLTLLTGVSVLGLGVGGTLAATGLIPNPFAPPAPDSTPEFSDSTPATPGNGAEPKFTDDWVKSCYNETTKETDLDCAQKGADRLREVKDSGWTGVKVFLNGDMLTFVFSMPISSYTEFYHEVLINGEKRKWGPIICWPEPSGMCTQSSNYQIAVPEFAYTEGAPCKPDGDFYLVRVSGPGLNFEEENRIPEGNLNCPSRPLPSGVLNPSLVTPTPTSESSSEPETSPTQTP